MDISFTLSFPAIVGYDHSLPPCFPLVSAAYWFAGENISLWAYMCSLQEMNLAPEQLLLEINNPTKEKIANYLIPLRIKGVKDCPDGQDYINFIQLNCNIIKVVVISKEINNPQLILPLQPIWIDNSFTKPPNAIANEVRTNWGWL